MAEDHQRSVRPPDGSRALVRIGKILRIHSARSIPPRDTAETNLPWVLPEAGPDIASRVVSRIRERLSTEPEHPALVSAGVRGLSGRWRHAEKLLGARTARSTP